jgi:adenylate kinase
MALNVIMLGPPGAGKGTQAERLAREHGIPKISTGDMLRAAAQDGTEVGRRAQAIMDRGELVSDDVMIGIVRDRLARPDAAGGFVLDGFPRTVAQATALDAIMNGRGPLIVVDIVVPEAELVRRLSTRMICESCGRTAGVLPLGAFRPGDRRAAGRTEACDRCAFCGGKLVQRTDDSDVVVRERLRVYRRNTKSLVDFYRHRPTFRSVDGAQPPDQVAADLTTEIAAARNARVGGRL